MGLAADSSMKKSRKFSKFDNQSIAFPVFVTNMDIAAIKMNLTDQLL